MLEIKSKSLKKFDHKCMPKIYLFIYCVCVQQVSLSYWYLSLYWVAKSLKERATNEQSTKYFHEELKDISEVLL